MSTYRTKSGRESRIPERFGTSTSQGATAAAPSQSTAASATPNQSARTEGTSTRNTESSTGGKSSLTWTADMERSFKEGLRRARQNREEASRQISGAIPTMTPAGGSPSFFTEADDTMIVAAIRRARERRVRAERQGSGPTTGAGDAGGQGDSARSVETGDDIIDMSDRDAESTPHPQSNANTSYQIEEGSDDGEGTGNGSENAGDESEEDVPVRSSGEEPAAASIPPWASQAAEGHRRSREREESILSEIPERPQPSINVGGSHQEFKILSINDWGSPKYRYGVATPDQQSLPRVYVKGTPGSDNTPDRITPPKDNGAPRTTLVRPSWMGPAERPAPSGASRIAAGSKGPAGPEKGQGTGWRAAQTLVRSVMETVTGGKAQKAPRVGEEKALPPPPKDDRPRESQRQQSEDEFGMTTDIEKYMSTYRTPPRTTNNSPDGKAKPNDTSESEPDMTNQIPTKEKGKGRVGFMNPVVQPTPMLHDARKAELERRERRRKELEERARQMEAEQLRIEEEYLETQYQLAILESEQMAMDRATKNEKEVAQGSQSDTETSATSEGKRKRDPAMADSSTEASGNEGSGRESDTPTTDTESVKEPPPAPKGKKKAEEKATKPKESKGGKEEPKVPPKEEPKPASKKKSKKAKGESKEEQGRPLETAMATPELILPREITLEEVKQLIREQMEGERQSHAPVSTFAPMPWRGSGLSRGKSVTPSTLGDASTLGRGQSTLRSDPSSEKESSSESSEKDTESEEDTKSKRKKENRQKREDKERKAAVKALSVGRPTVWNGSPVYERFDAWVDQVDEWRRNHALSEYATIATMGFMLSGQAKDWYKIHVREREREWTLERLNSKLFDEMFPPDIDSILRRMFNGATQGDGSIKSWYKYLTKLAARVPYLSEHDVRRRFMEGAQGHLREKWAEAGMQPEDPSLTIDMLYESGLRFERARAIYLAERKQTFSKSKGSGGATSNDHQGKDKGQNARKSDFKGTRPQEKGGGGAQKSGQDAQKRRNPENSGGVKRKELTEKEKAELRAEDRCFDCKETGHTQRNCPKRREISPNHRKGGKKPTLYSASLRFEAMKKAKGGPTIRLNMIEPLAANGVIASARKAKEERIRAHQHAEQRESVGLIGRILHTYLMRQLGEVKPDHEWQRHLPMRLSRFKVETESEGVFSVHDTWDGWLAELEAKNIFDPSFNVGQWVKEMKKTAPLFFDLREPGATVPNEETSSEESDESSEESGKESDEDSDEEYEEISMDSGRRSSRETSDDDMPELGEPSDSESNSEGEASSGEESENGTEWSGTRSDNSLTSKLWRGLTQLRSKFRSSVAPEAGIESDDDSGGENPPSAKRSHPIRCTVAQTAKPRPKTKPKESKAKKKFWESIETNSGTPKDEDRVMPHPIILTVYVNGRACRALLDSGAFSDFISTTLVDNLGLKKKILSESLTLQMAVQGSRSKILASTTVDFSYSTIKCQKTFDIINIANYDMILGTPFYWQHKILAGMNPTRVAIGSNDPLPYTGEDIHTILGAMSIEKEDELQKVRDMLAAEAKDLCEDTATSALPPFRAINHHIPLIDESKVYKYRPSKCPRALEPMWREKSGEYLRTGRWRVATGTNPTPLLLIQKPRKGPEDPIKLRACFDKREQNANTRKLASPLPDQTEVLERIASHKYRTVIDGRDAYEQIRVAKEDVWKTLFNSPSGTMESLVLQQGDCNGPATYQSLMNHIFGPYIGVWMDVYLDDIMIYSNSLKDHIKHVRIVFKILREQKLFLNPKKMQFLATELHVLGHRITDEGIKMDPYKVDSIAKWPTPTNKDLLSQFIGAVGYLADGVRGVRIPMAVLNKLVGSKKIFRWGPTEQRAFEQTKALVEEYCQKTRVPLSYDKEAPKIWLVTDASMTGAAGHVCQGDDWKTAKPVAFWSGKFSSAEQAYRTHEQELLAIIESLKRFRHHLLGTKFTIVTDHERLESFMTQKDLTRRQARWLETLSDFDFDVVWTPGKSNIFADALSRIYSNDAKGTERAESEQVTTEEPEYEGGPSLGLFSVEASEQPSRPIIVGDHIEAEMKVLMAAGVKSRRNPQRGKGKRETLQESDQHSSGELEMSEASDSSVSEAGATWGGGEIRKSVPERAIKPLDSPHDGETSVVPAPRGAAGKGMSTPKSAKSNKRRVDETDEDGESEIEEAPQYSHKNTSKKKEYEAMLERRKAKESPISQSRQRPSDSGDDQEKVNGRSNKLKPSGELREAEEQRRNAREELLQAEADHQEGRLPHPEDENGSLERALDVQLTDVIKDVEFPHNLEGRYAEDEFFKVVLKNPLHYTNFEVMGDKGKELIYLKDSQRQILCIPDISIGSRRAREIVITHAHSILAHLGARKTLWYLRENVWWKEMIKDITDYCASCDVCARTKSTNQKPMGLLHPLKVPTRPWEQIGVDFVGPLPEAKNCYGAFDQVMVVIDHLTSMVHLIPAKINYRARQIAEIFYDTVYKLHGLPERIISDRDKIFTSIFWQNLHRLMRVNLKLSSTYHPQTDGATERANRTMVQMIRQAIGAKDSRWLERLPAIEWAMNAARSETTGFSPFFLNYGYKPRPLIWNNASKDEYPGVHAFAQRMKDAILTAHDAILEKRVKQTRQANKGRRPAPFTDGDLVYLSTRNLKLPKGKTRKLVPKYIGPYKITKVLVPGTSYRLELPADLRSRGIHNAFHASLLRLYVPSCDTRFPGRQVEQLAAFGEADEDWEASKIRSHHGTGEDALFELEWTSGDVTWEPLYRVRELEALTEYLEAMGVSDVKYLKKGKGTPPSDDPETFIGVLRPIKTEVEENIKAEGDEPTPAIESFIPPFLYNIPIPPSKPTLLIMQQNNRRYDPRNFTTYPRPALRTRMGTPHPEPKPTPLAPAFRLTRRSSFDSLDVATEIAIAGTTPDVAKEIRDNVAKMTGTAAKRAQLYKDVKERPDLFFNRIGMRYIADKTWKSVEQNMTGPIRTRDTKGQHVCFAKPTKTTKPAKTPIPEKAPKPAKSPKPPTAPKAMQVAQQNQELLQSTTQLVAVVKDLLAATSINNALVPPSIDAMMEIPPFLPRIQPAPLPSVPVIPEQPDFELDALFSQDIVMGDASIGQGEEVTAEETSEDNIGDDYEQVNGSEVPLFGSET